jgi:hypothetical protein
MWMVVGVAAVPTQLEPSGLYVDFRQVSMRMSLSPRGCVCRAPVRCPATGVRQCATSKVVTWGTNRVSPSFAVARAVTLHVPGSRSVASFVVTFSV